MLRGADATAGDPLFVLTAEANAGPVKMLPPVLDEIRGLVGDRRVTVVFDRGGYSPALVLRLLTAGFDLLTYRKGRVRRVPREVTRRTDDGHQTPILTSRRDLLAIDVAVRMFGRWRQENFLKYLREECALDALVDYSVVPDDPARDVPNPRWRDRDVQLRQARAEVARLSKTYARAHLRIEITGLGVEAAARKIKESVEVHAAKAATLPIAGSPGQGLVPSWSPTDRRG